MSNVAHQCSEKSRASPHSANDPDTPNPWLPSRTVATCSMSNLISAIFVKIFDPVRVGLRPAKTDENPSEPGIMRKAR